MAITAEQIDNHDVDFAAWLKLRGTAMRHGGGPNKEIALWVSAR